jgi:hypothetical protein
MKKARLRPGFFIHVIRRENQLNLPPLPAAL